MQISHLKTAANKVREIIPILVWRRLVGSKVGIEDHRAVIVSAKPPSMICCVIIKIMFQSRQFAVSIYVVQEINWCKETALFLRSQHNNSSGEVKV